MRTNSPTKLGLKRQTASLRLAVFFVPMKNKTKRWANPIEFEQHSLGLPIEQLARILQRTPRTVRDWQLGNRPIPAWAPELLRLRHVEGQQYRRQLEVMKLDARKQKIAYRDPNDATSCGKSS